MAAPTMEELVQQVVQLGRQVHTLTAQLAAANSTIQQLESSAQRTGKTAWCGFVDKKQMMPDRIADKKDGLEWADDFMDHCEEVQPEMAVQPDRARWVEEEISPQYPNPESKKIAVATFRLLKKSIKESEGKKLLKSLRDTKNPFESWRLLWFTYKPSTRGDGDIRSQEAHQSAKGKEDSPCHPHDEELGAQACRVLRAEWG